MAGGWALLDAKRNASANTLAKAVADGFTDPDTRAAVQRHLQAQFQGAKMPDVKSRAIVELQSVSAVLDRKVPQDAQAFKGWLREVAQKAAEAGTEGGFLGFGGVAVSDSEKATLAEISTALGSGAARS